MRQYVTQRGFGSAWHVQERATGRLVGPPRTRREARREARRLNVARSMTSHATLKQC